MIAIQAGDDTVKEMRSEDARLFDQMEVVGAVRGKGGEIFVKSYQNGNFPPGTKPQTKRVADSQSRSTCRSLSLSIALCRLNGFN
jgi:hypothetical protein